MNFVLCVYILHIQRQLGLSVCINMANGAAEHWTETHVTCGCRESCCPCNRLNVCVPLKRRWSLWKVIRS